MMVFKDKFIYPALLTLIIYMGVFSVCAFAQGRMKFASTEDVAIALYKTAGKIPNFERWIKSTEPYNRTAWARRDALMEKELLRLRTAYNDFNPEENHLNIRTFVTVQPEVTQNELGEETYSIKSTFINAPDALYFPYDFIDQRIVVMPHKLDIMMHRQIDKRQYDRIVEALRASPENTMIVVLKPTEGDLSRPYKIDGLDQWVLKAQIVSLEIWTQQGTLLWQFTAPWYVSPRTKKLNNLFEARPTGSSERGSVKPLFQN